ncbi:MAG: hypothetical protein IKR25_12930, partial [Muribaculaceae bacterium]|nr:hypothetical protein [Muribaculaceae bacterium]
MAIENNQFVMPAANVTINATFAAIDYTITVAATENGTVAAPATANIGETVTLTVTPATGYELETLTYTVEGADPMAIENNQFVMPAANVTINATFAAIDYEVVIAETEHGTVEADKATANMGETVTLTVTPAEGYELDALEVIAGADTPVEITYDSETGKYTFEMPAEIVSVVATFKGIPVVLDGVVFDENNTYATWYGEANLALPNDVTAWVVTGIDGDVAVIDQVAYIPAGVGVLLHSTTAAETVSAAPYTGETAEMTSMLVGTLNDMAIADGYVLYNDTFVLAKAGTLAAHRCYLPMPAPAGAPMRLRIGAGGVVTAINDICTDNGNVTYVNMMGQMSNRPFQGVNIIMQNGKAIGKVVK